MALEIIDRLLANTLSHHFWSAIAPYAGPFLGPWILPVVWILRLLLLFNIFSAFLPLFRGEDELLDIPLTPSQRSLLGLDPRASPPASTGTEYVTPPRYPRSATPRSDTSVSHGNSPADSATSWNQSPLAGRQVSGSNSPIANGLWQKSLVGSKEMRKIGYGGPSPLGQSTSTDLSLFAPPSTPSPLGKGASVPLNSRWLYERGRSSSGSRLAY